MTKATMQATLNLRILITIRCGRPLIPNKTRQHGKSCSPLFHVGATPGAIRPPVASEFKRASC